VSNSEIIGVQHQKDIAAHFDPFFNPTVRQTLMRFGPQNSEEFTAQIDRLYFPSGEFIYQTPDDIDFRNGTVSNIRSVLELRLKPIYDLIDLRLREDKPENGFNKHNLENHIIPVAEMVDQIAKDANFTERQRKLAIIAAYAHDIGNINSRKNHANDSADLLPYILPSILKYEEDWDVIEFAIRHHDERILEDLFGKNNVQNEDQRLRYSLNVEDGQAEDKLLVAAALIFADKADISRGRVNEAAINIDALEGDPHVWPNMCSRSEGIRHHPSSRVLTFGLSFDHRLEGDDEIKFEPVRHDRSNHPGFRIYHPQRIYNQYHDSKIPLFDLWRRELNVTYGRRFDLMAEMASYLFENLDHFEINFDDHLGLVYKITEKGSGDPEEDIRRRSIQSTRTTQFYYPEALLAQRAHGGLIRQEGGSKNAAHRVHGPAIWETE
jgi:hypothetical protein